MAAGVALLVLLTLPGAVLGSGEEIGRVPRLQGQVVVERDGVTLALAQHGRIFVGDVVATGAAGRLELAMADGTVLTLGGDTRFKFREFDFQPEADKGRVLLELAKGAFRIVTGELNKRQGSLLTVRTPRATIGIRGTDAWGGFLKGDRFGVLMLKGTGVVISNQAGSVEIKTPGFGVWVKSAATAPRPDSAEKSIPEGLGVWERPVDLPLPQPEVWKEEDVSKAVATIAFAQ